MIRRDGVVQVQVEPSATSMAYAVDCCWVSARPGAGGKAGGRTPWLMMFRMCAAALGSMWSHSLLSTGRLSSARSSMRKT